MDKLQAQKRIDSEFSKEPSNSVNVMVPVGRIDPEQPNAGISPALVTRAQIYCLQLKDKFAPQIEQDNADIFYNQMKRQQEENQYGCTLGVKRLRLSTIDIRRELDEVKKHLAIDKAPVETLGSDAIDRLYSKLKTDMMGFCNEINQRISQMEQEIHEATSGDKGNKRIVRLNEDSDEHDSNKEVFIYRPERSSSGYSNS